MNKHNDSVFLNLLNLQNESDTGLNSSYASYIKSLYDINSFTNKQDINKYNNLDENTYFNEKTKNDLLKTSLEDVYDKIENNSIKDDIMDTYHNEEFTVKKNYTIIIVIILLFFVLYILKK